MERCVCVRKSNRCSNYLEVERFYHAITNILSFKSVLFTRSDLEVNTS